MFLKSCVSNCETVLKRLLSVLPNKHKIVHTGVYSGTDWRNVLKEGAFLNAPLLTDVYTSETPNLRKVIWGRTVLIHLA